MLDKLAIFSYYIKNKYVNQVLVPFTCLVCQKVKISWNFFEQKRHIYPHKVKSMMVLSVPALRFSDSYRTALKSSKQLIAL